MSIEAKYENDCAACDGPIRVGELIDRDPFTEMWMHEECPERKARPVCNQCFMEIALNGECSC